MFLVTLVIAVFLGSMPGEYWIFLDNNEPLSGFLEVDDQIKVMKYSSGKTTELLPAKTVIRVKNSKNYLSKNGFAINVNWYERLTLWRCEFLGEVKIGVSGVADW